MSPATRPLGARLRQAFFSSPFNTLLSLIGLWIVIMVLPGLLDWALFSATFQADSATECRQNNGACWAFIAEKHRLILFGLYPYDEQWRPLLASLLLILGLVLSCRRSFWNRRLLLVWGLLLPASAVLMWGGVLGLSYVENALWGGLPLTLMLSTFGIAFAFPLGVLLALGRRSHLPIIRALSVTYIELIRGVPLISVLFMSSVMLPLFLPEGWGIDKLLRAQIAIILFSAAYVAETVRGGLQSVDTGQLEGAASLGMGYWQTMRLVVLPQALRAVVGPLVGLFIGLFKDTSLVVIIGLFDLTQAAKASLTDVSWAGFSIEAYLFVACIYFAFCYAMSRYSQTLESTPQVKHVKA